MAHWTFREFASFEVFTEYMNGSVVGWRAGGNIYEGALVDSLTLIIDTTGTPRTVTFTPTKSRAWTKEEIVAQIHNAHADLVGVASWIWVNPAGSPPDARLRLYNSGGNLTLDKDGTANTLLGYQGSAGSDESQAQILDTSLNRVLHDPDGQNRVIAIFYV